MAIVGSGCTANRRTKNTAATCANVFAFPKTLGRKSRKPAIMYNTALTARIEMSRLKTMTVNFQSLKTTLNGFLVETAFPAAELFKELLQRGVMQ